MSWRIALIKSRLTYRGYLLVMVFSRHGYISLPNTALRVVNIYHGNRSTCLANLLLYQTY